MINVETRGGASQWNVMRSWTLLTLAVEFSITQRPLGGCSTVPASGKGSDTIHQWVTITGSTASQQEQAMHGVMLPFESTNVKSKETDDANQK